MKKLATLVFALLLACSLSFAQAAGGGTASQAPADASKPADTSKKAHKGGKKGHKGGKKAKKSTTETTPAPK
jgi:Spy/CpxP family protein refolding chaperone